MKAILLAGGRGSRLRPLTDTMPKAMVPVGGKPILQWQIEWLKGFGLRQFVLSIGHLAHVVQRKFGDGDILGVEIQYIVEQQPLGTGGALKKAIIDGKVTSSFLVTNGDVLTDLDPRFADNLRDSKNLTGAIHLVNLPSPYGIVETGEDSLVQEFREKPELEDYWINAGVYAFSQDVLPYLPDKGSLEHDVFPVLAKNNQLLGYKVQPNLWRSIDTHKDLEETATALRP